MYVHSVYVPAVHYTNYAVKWHLLCHNRFYTNVPPPVTTKTEVVDAYDAMYNNLVDKREKYHLIAAMWVEMFLFIMLWKQEIESFVNKIYCEHQSHFIKALIALKDSSTG